MAIVQPAKMEKPTATPLPVLTCEHSRSRRTYATGAAAAGATCPDRGAASAARCCCRPSALPSGAAYSSPARHRAMPGCVCALQHAGAEGVRTREYAYVRLRRLCLPQPEAPAASGRAVQRRCACSAQGCTSVSGGTAPIHGIMPSSQSNTTLPTIPAICPFDMPMLRASQII